MDNSTVKRMFVIAVLSKSQILFLQTDKKQNLQKDKENLSHASKKILLNGDKIYNQNHTEIRRADRPIVQNFAAKTL